MMIGNVLAEMCDDYRSDYGASSLTSRKEDQCGPNQ